AHEVLRNARLFVAGGFARRMELRTSPRSELRALLRRFYGDSARPWRDGFASHGDPDRSHYHRTPASKSKVRCSDRWRPDAGCRRLSDLSRSSHQPLNDPLKGNSLE